MNKYYIVWIDCDSCRLIEIEAKSAEEAIKYCFGYFGNDFLKKIKDFVTTHKIRIFVFDSHPVHSLGQFECPDLQLVPIITKALAHSFLDWESEQPKRKDFMNIDKETFALWIFERDLKEGCFDDDHKPPLSFGVLPKDEKIMYLKEAEMYMTMDPFGNDGSVGWPNFILERLTSPKTSG